ncbi:MAG: hypothetical protein ACKOE6_05105, partial [Flammeovirgaceae bacterium]
MKRIFASGLCLLMAVAVNAQFGDFGKRALDKAKQKLQTEVKNQTDPETVRARLDSSDFNYAISVIDNSGIMNLASLREDLIKGGTSIKAGVET